MKEAVEMGLDGKIYVPSLVKINLGIQTFFFGRGTYGRIHSKMIS
jgi:hypothetical protein